MKRALYVVSVMAGLSVVLMGQASATESPTPLVGAVLGGGGGGGGGRKEPPPETDEPPAEPEIDPAEEAAIAERARVLEEVVALRARAKKTGKSAVLSLAGSIPIGVLGIVLWVLVPNTYGRALGAALMVVGGGLLVIGAVEFGIAASYKARARRLEATVPAEAKPGWAIVPTIAPVRGLSFVMTF